MKIPFLVRGLVSACLRHHSTCIHVKSRVIICMRIQVCFHLFLTYFFHIYSLTTHHRANLEIFRDMNHIRADLSVKYGDKVTGLGSKFTSSIPKMLLNCLNFCKILMVQKRQFFFWGIFSRGLSIYCVFLLFCVHTCKTCRYWWG